MHLVVAEATAREENQLCEPGDRHAILLFVRAESADEALTIAASGLDGHGWAAVRFSKTKVVDDDHEPVDEVFRRAFRSALSEGCALVTYSEPIESDDGR